jgi:hypothetical protein
MLEGTANWLIGFLHTLEGESLPEPLDSSRATNALEG